MKLNDNWEFYSPEFNNKQRYVTNIPTSVQYALFREGVLSDYNVALNEIEYVPLENMAWVFEKRFYVETIQYKFNRLVFKGIDTFASVYLNGVFLGFTENMFLEYEFDVSDVLTEGENILELRFEKILDYLEGKIAEYGNQQLYTSMDIRRNYARKMHCSFGWDWGVRILETGIWKEVCLEQFNENKIRFINAQLVDMDEILIEGELSGAPKETVVQCGLSFLGELVHEFSVTAINNIFTAKIKIPDLKLWYPNGYGRQNLYEITVETAEDKKTIETGFRTVRLVREKLDEGELFVFEVNGVKIFCKGACTIPLDAFLNRVTNEDYKFYIQKAKESNMNMLRVWGGGIYEDEEFYSQCNKNGIMVWQDFMFSCAEYPDNIPEFADNCKKEIIYNLKRIRYNPCIVLYCGNNENNWLMQLNTDKSDNYPYSGNYIYKTIIPECCCELVPDTPYWVSSPYSEKGDCNSYKTGDVHDWSVFCYNKDIEEYEQCDGRFISEFGMHGAPHLKTMREYMPEGERRIMSEVSFSHNKSTGGIETGLGYIMTNVGGYNDFEDYLTLSQFVQAEGVKIGIEHWRSNKFRTAGTLFWQFNDNWCTTSYSYIDYRKREKALFYYIRRLYADILVAMKAKGEELKITLVNDRTSDVKGSLKIRAYTLGGQLVYEQAENVQVSANAKQVVFEKNITTFIESRGKFAYPDYSYKYPSNLDLGCLNVREVDNVLRDVVFTVELDVDGKRYTNYKTMVKFRRLRLEKPNIDVKINGNEITLISDKPAFSVYIETDCDSYLSDNFLFLEPSREYKIKATAPVRSVRVKELYSMTDKRV